MKHSKLIFIIVSLAFLGRYVCLGDNVGVILQTSGTKIVLPGNWEKLNQPATFFVQQRARNSDTGVAVSAGTIKSDLPLEQYTALGIAGLMSGPERQLERIAELARVPVTEVKKALESHTGQQTLAQMKQIKNTMHSELLSVVQLKISDAAAFEIHSKVTFLKSGQTVFTRQFSYAGAGLDEIVTITYAGSSEDIFQDNTLLEAIHRLGKNQSQPLEATAIQKPDNSTNMEIDRKTFSLSLPGKWTEKTKDDMYERDSFIFFDGPESCFFNVVIGKKSAGASVDALVTKQRDGMQKKFTDWTLTLITKWSNYDGKGYEIQGKIQGIIRARVRIFGFEKDDNVCLVIEYATLVDFTKYSGDFEQIRQTFKLK